MTMKRIALFFTASCLFISLFGLFSGENSGQRLFAKDVAAAPALCSTQSIADTQNYGKLCRQYLTSPDGQRHWLMICSNVLIELDCHILLPNGERTAMSSWPGEWSNDGQFLLVPEGGTHDSYPGGYELWDMNQNKRIANFTPVINGLMSWEPETSTVIYSSSASSQLTEFNALTRESSLADSCPDWLFKRFGDFLKDLTKSC
jgi:hypothetical protein